MLRHGYSADELSPGMSASFAKTIMQSDILPFADVSGDINPVNLGQDYVATVSFGGGVAHGVLSPRFISAVLANELPGPSAICLSQTLNFRAPVRSGDVVTATLTVKSIFPHHRRVALDIACTVGDAIVVEGEAILLVPVRHVSAAVVAIPSQSVI